MTKAIIKTLLSKLLNTPLVIEEGTSGAWKYRKWSTGKTEAWSYCSVSQQTGTVWTNTLWYVDITVSIPSGIFSSVPRVYGLANDNQWQLYGTYSRSATSMRVRFTKPSNNNVAGGADLYLVST